MRPNSPTRTGIATYDTAGLPPGPPSHTRFEPVTESQVVRLGQREPLVQAPAASCVPAPLEPAAAIDRTSAHRIFRHMQQRHLPPGHLSIDLLCDALPVARWEASSIYRSLTHSQRRCAPLSPKVQATLRSRTALPSEMRSWALRVDGVLSAITDHTPQRTALHNRLCVIRSRLAEARRDAASTIAIRDADIAELKAEMLALSARVYAWPFEA